jgi:hypothetical protein
MVKKTRPSIGPGAPIFDQAPVKEGYANSWGGPDGNTFMLGGMQGQNRPRPGLRGSGFRPRDFMPGGRALQPGADLSSIDPTLLQRLMQAGILPAFQFGGAGGGGMGGTQFGGGGVAPFGGIGLPTPSKISPLPRVGLFS